MTQVDSTPRERRHARTRQAILDAARHIIGREGVNGLSMRAIADEIDYSAAGLYEYFDGKEAIVTELCRLGHERLSAAMQSRLSSDPTMSFEEALLAIGQAYIGFAQHNPDLYVVMFTQDTANATERMVDEGSSYLILLGVIQRGLTEGAITAREGFGLNEMAFTAWSTVHGIAMLAITFFRAAPINLNHPQNEALMNMIKGFKN